MSRCVIDEREYEGGQAVLHRAADELLLDIFKLIEEHWSLAKTQTDGCTTGVESNSENTVRTHTLCTLSFYSTMFQGGRLQFLLHYIHLTAIIISFKQHNIFNST